MRQRKGFMELFPGVVASPEDPVWQSRLPRGHSAVSDLHRVQNGLDQLDDVDGAGKNLE